jgi:uncharacterized membrane protein/thiol-disulfide isomerase/thioredoxin
MRMTSRHLLLILLVFWLTSAAMTVAPQTNGDQAVVHVVLFYSPACGHCYYVITEVMPPLLEKYGDQLQILAVNANTPEGSALFRNAMSYFGMESAGVPFLVIKDQYLIGSLDIPEKFPELIDLYLVQGGVAFPTLPGLMDVPLTFLAAPTPAIPEATEQSGESSVSSIGIMPQTSISFYESTTVVDRFLHDPVGNSFSILILLAMIFSLGLAVKRFKMKSISSQSNQYFWLIIFLCMAGLIVSGYLAYVENNGLQAVCGPVGDCNTVQQSEYARLFGFLPIGILGLFGFVMILLASIFQQKTNDIFSAFAGMILLFLTSFGALFSIYLTFLEPFVIGATCAWCLTSAIIMTLLFQLSLPIGKQSIAFLKSGKSQV